MRARAMMAVFGALALVAVSCSGSSLIRVTTEITDLSPRFSPDGSQIVFASDRGGTTDLYVLTLVTGEIVRVTSTEGTEADPTYAPDGTVVYVFRATADDPWNLYRLSDDEPSLILETSAAFPDVSSSLDVVHACVLPGGFGICVVGLDGSDPQIVHNDPQARDWEPVWSPDGQSIAFVSDRDGDDEILVIDHNGIRQLTDNDIKDADPAWSPDGTQLAFTSDRDGAQAVWVMDSDGLNPRRLVDGAKPAWSPDGLSIAHHAVPLLPELGLAIAVTVVATGETEIVSRDRS